MLDLAALREAFRYEGGLSRRLFLAYGAALSSVPLLSRGASAQPTKFSDDPFTLGVASGDPDARSVVIWTRLAPKPLQPGGGMPNHAAEVFWEVAGDEGMKSIVASGKALATPQLGHAVHVEVKNLKPDRWYWYRFRAGDAESPVGRTRTLPAPSAMPQQVRFAVASCQHYEHGLYTAYEQMARDDLDLVFFLGDYIYEYKGAGGKVRKHLGDEIESLDDYRIRYAQYRSDPLLHGMHANCPWFLTWDDHEFDNNYADEVSEEKGVDPVKFMIRRANAYQAYYEIMPLRRRSLPTGPDMQLYRRAPYGRLAELLVLDTRQYRTDQPNGDGRAPLNDAARNPSNTLLGRRQKKWLYQKLIASQATWNVLAQQVMMGTVGFPDPRPGYSMDQWPGYVAEREQLMEFMRDRKVPNPVVLTGDIHANWANELRVDDHQEHLEPVATEFVGTSISSGGNGHSNETEAQNLMKENPCIKYQDRHRGYIRCTVTPKTWQADFMRAAEIQKPGGKVTVGKSVIVEAGQARIKDA